MQILGTPFNAIDESFIDYLVKENIPESRTHDYKSQLPHPKDTAGRSRFLASASAFANTEGGVFVFGVAEQGTKLNDAGLENFDPNRDVLNLQNFLRSGLESWLPLTVPKVIPRQGRNPIFLLGIPFSLSSPHSVNNNYKDGAGFWYRDDRGNHPMSVSQLRAAFLGRETWKADAGNFVRDRLEYISKNNLISPTDGLLLVELLPLGRLRDQISFPDSEPNWYQSFVDHGDFDIRPNLDGWLLKRTYSEEFSLFWQLFRNGGVEFCSSLNNHTLLDHGNTFKDKIDGLSLDQGIQTVLDRAFKWCTKMNLTSPVSIHVTMTNMLDKRLWYGRSIKHGFDRSIISIPPLYLDSIPTSVLPSCLPVLETIWQSAGWKNRPQIASEIPG